MLSRCPVHMLKKAIKSVTSARQRQVVKGYLRRIRLLLGLPAFLEGDDRRILEHIILPFVSDSDAYQEILFVGCDWYTRSYQQLFFDQKNYHTIDFDPKKRKFGSRQHVVGAVTDLNLFYQPESMDVIICNGVLGWGLNQVAEIEKAYSNYHDVLRPKGLLMVGWDDLPPYNVIDPHAVQSLKRFEKYVFPPLHVHRYATQTPYRHIYDFYRKRW